MNESKPSFPAPEVAQQMHAWHGNYSPPQMTYRQWLVGLAMQGDMARTNVHLDLGLWERRWCEVADAAIRAERETREE